MNCKFLPSLFTGIALSRCIVATNLGLFVAMVISDLVAFACAILLYYSLKRNMIVSSDDQFTLNALRFQCKTGERDLVSISVRLSEISENFCSLVHQSSERPSVGDVLLELGEMTPEISDPIREQRSYPMIRKKRSSDL